MYVKIINLCVIFFVNIKCLLVSHVPTLIIYHLHVICFILDMYEFKRILIILTLNYYIHD